MSFDLTVGMSKAKLPVVLPGRDGLVTVYVISRFRKCLPLTCTNLSTDLPFGKGQRILYSTANLLSTFDFNGEDTLVVYGTKGMTYQLAFTIDSQPTVAVTGPTKITSKYSSVRYLLT